MFPLGKTAFLVDLGRGVGKDAGSYFSHVTQLLFFYLAGWSQDQGCSYKSPQQGRQLSKKLAWWFVHYVTILRANWTGCAFTSPDTAGIPRELSCISWRDKELAVLHRVRSSFPARSWTAGEALAGPVSLPALWTSTAAEPNVPSEVGKSGKDK